MFFDPVMRDQVRMRSEIESSLLQDAEQAIAKMNRLKERGVRFSLDDFGTGNSSLSALKRLPLAKLENRLTDGFTPLTAADN